MGSALDQYCQPGRPCSFRSLCYDGDDGLCIRLSLYRPLLPKADNPKLCVRIRREHSSLGSALELVFQAGESVGAADLAAGESLSRLQEPHPKRPPLLPPGALSGAGRPDTCHANHLLAPKGALLKLLHPRCPPCPIRRAQF